MPVRPARAAHPAGLGRAGAGRGFAAPGGRRRREHRKLFDQLRGTTVGTFRTLPFTGTHQDFAVRFAFLAMKFVNWHGPRIVAEATKLKAFDGPERVV